MVGGFTVVPLERRSGVFRCICGKRTTSDRGDFHDHCNKYCRFYLVMDGSANESKEEEIEDEEEEASRTGDQPPSLTASHVEEMIKTGGVVVHHSTLLGSPDAYTVLCTACSHVFRVSHSAFYLL